MTFVVFTDCGSCTRPISTNPVSMEAGEYGPTRGARFFAVCLEVVAVAGRMWVSWCVFGGAGFCRVFQVTTFSISYTKSSQRRLGEGARTASQSAHGELAPTCPHQGYRLVYSHLRNMASSVDQQSRSYSPTSQPDLRPHGCNLNNFSSFESASSNCSRDRTLRYTYGSCLLYTSPSPRDLSTSRMPSSA